ncbi:MAG: DMT family transporter [Cytophagales bacterium]|nr:DMT family transporter [Cytophagales bacterium]
MGSVLILICAFTFASYIVGSGRLIPMVGASKFNSYAMSFASLGVLLHFFITSNVPLWHFPSKVYVYSFSMAILSTVIPSYLISEGIKRVGSDNVAIIASIGPVSTIGMASFFLDEPVFLRPNCRHDSNFAQECFWLADKNAILYNEVKDVLQLKVVGHLSSK